MKVTEKLVKRLREEGVLIPDGWTFHHTYAGRNMRSGGAWSWWIEARGFEVIGSVWPASDIVRAPEIQISKSMHSWTPEVDPIFTRCSRCNRRDYTVKTRKDCEVCGPTPMCETCWLAHEPERNIL